MTGDRPACDRCGISDPLVHLIAWPADEQTYWLCQGCINAVVLVWLVEHKQLIITNRETRTRQPEDQAPQGRARGP